MVPNSGSMSQVSIYDLSGGNGSEYITTAGTTANFFAVQFLSDSVIGTLTGNMDGTPTETFNKGDVIFGRFDYIKLSSGSAQLYLCYQSAGAASSVTRQSDLVGWWKFDDSVAVSGAADSTSTGNVATCNAVTGLAGINNKSFAFGNGYRNVIVPGHASYPTASDFSIGMWVYWDSPSPATANQAICSTGGYSQATGNWCVRVDDISGASPTLNFFAQDGTTDILSSAYSQSISPTLNTWHHVMMVYTSSSNTVTLIGMEWTWETRL